MLRSSLKEEEKHKVIIFLSANVDVFAWQPYDMPGIDAKVMCYRLHIDKGFRLIKHKTRRSTPEKAKAMEEEVYKLLKSGAIRETEYLKWISNLVVVRKKNWEMEGVCRLH